MSTRWRIIRILAPQLTFQSGLEKFEIPRRKFLDVNKVMERYQRWQRRLRLPHAFSCSPYTVNVVAQLHNGIHKSVYKHKRLYHLLTGLASSAQPVFSMPHRGMKAPTGINYNSVDNWRR